MFDGDKFMDAIGFGALNLDKIYSVNKILKEDNEDFIKNIEFHSGGSAANTIVGLSRLGINAGYIGKTGNDKEGFILINDLKKENIDISALIKENGRSGNALIFVDDAGNRCIYIDPGVNDNIRFNEIDLNYVNKFKIIHLTSFACKNSNESFITQNKIVENINIKVSFDPGMIYIEKGLECLKNIIKRTTIFLPNKYEIEKLFETNYKDACIKAINLGAKIVCVKLGEKGSYIVDNKNNEYYVPAFKTDAVDTTGAGDAFNAGFIYAYLKGKNLEECGKAGNYVASECIKSKGARNGLPERIIY